MLVLPEFMVAQPNRYIRPVLYLSTIGEFKEVVIIKNGITPKVSGRKVFLTLKAIQDKIILIDK
jgi:hypothetical protein